jgi:hypothetical protein
MKNKLSQLDVLCGVRRDNPRLLDYYEFLEGAECIDSMAHAG